jgi:hypothetical protein
LPSSHRDVEIPAFWSAKKVQVILKRNPIFGPGWVVACGDKPSAVLRPCVTAQFCPKGNCTYVYVPPRVTRERQVRLESWTSRRKRSAIAGQAQATRQNLHSIPSSRPERMDRRQSKAPIRATSLFVPRAWAIERPRVRKRKRASSIS